MIIAVHQPQFMPWLGFFDKMDSADIFVYLDNVQYRKNEYQNRNRLKTPRGWQWLTVPVTYKYPERICEVRINNNVNWKKKHLLSLETNYRKAPYFKTYFSEILKLYSKEVTNLSEFNIDTIELIAGFLGINKRTCRASEIKVLRDDRNLRLVDICKYFNADTYLSGSGGKGYIDASVFHREGIKVVFQSFDHPVYPQIYDEFLPFMSSIDLLLNCGEEGLKILRGGRVPR